MTKMMEQRPTRERKLADDGVETEAGSCPNVRVQCGSFTERW
jgi:hypothetical protein